MKVYKWNCDWCDLPRFKNASLDEIANAKLTIDEEFLELTSEELKAFEQEEIDGLVWDEKRYWIRAKSKEDARLVFLADMRYDQWAKEQAFYESENSN